MTRLLVLLVFLLLVFIPLIFLLTHSYGFFSPAFVVAVVVFFFAVNLTLLLFESSHSFTHEGSGLSAEKIQFMKVDSTEQRQQQQQQRQ